MSIWKLTPVECVFAVTALFGLRIAGAAESPDAKDPLQFYVLDRYTYDDNLFRIPDATPASDPSIVPPASLDDYFNRASAGARIRADSSRQVFFADLRIDDVRYQRNDDLNYTGGSGNLGWDWQAGHRWSGKLNAQYDRSQASLANYLFFGKDLVDTAILGAEFRLGIGSRWRLLAAGAAADTDHSSDVRRVNNFESQTGRGGIEYLTPAGNLFALEYRYTDADFPVARDLGADLAYEERVPGVRMEYVFTEKTQLRARAGYLEREYANPASGDYSGEIWDLALHWEPRTKLSFDIKLWHELKAYADSESDYFVTDGGSITPTWEPTSKIKVAAAFAYEQQDYIGAGVLLPTVEGDRQDDVSSALLSIDYTPRDIVTIGLGYRWIDRESNRDFRAYDDSMVSAQLRINL